MIKKTNLKSIYANLCRYYAKKLGDRPGDLVYRLLCSLKFYKEHGYYPRFKKPRTFSEKIWYRMLFDRNPIWTELSDKLKAKEFVKKRIGERHIVPSLWIGQRAEEIPFEKLPNKFVIKTNHGGGYNIIVTDRESLDRAKTIHKINTWLKASFTYTKFLGMAWAYKNIDPKVFIELFIEENGKIPLDYKFFCFSGRVEYLLITYDRFGYHREKHFYKDFTPLDLWNGADQYAGPFIRPENFEEMIEIAENLSAGFDFIRVDLYNIKGKIYFGEFTCYPAGGLARFVPRNWDFIFGEKWNLKIV